MSQTSSTERLGSTISFNSTGICLPSNSIISALLLSGFSRNPFCEVTIAEALLPSEI
jgi:hypothetical protein